MKKKILVLFSVIALLVSLIIPSFTAFAGTAEKAEITVITADVEADAEAETEAKAPAKAEKKSPVKGIIISIIIGLIIGAIAILVVRSKYKPVHLKANATNYLVSGSYQRTGSYENYLRTDKSQREINSNN